MNEAHLLECSQLMEKNLTITSFLTYGQYLPMSESQLLNAIAIQDIFY